MRSTSPKIFIAAMAFGIFALDQLSKYWLLEIYHIAAKTPVHLHEYFTLVMAWNRGVSFSMFTNANATMPYVLAAMAAIVSALLWRLSLKSPRTIERIGYAMVIGGALGNALDRLRFGAVADFFYAHVGDLGWPAFNVADMGICTGVTLLFFSLINPPARP